MVRKEEGRKKRELIVSTFNLRRDMFYDYGSRWSRRKRIAADLIKTTGASIIGVQELLPEMKEDLESVLTGYTFLGKGRNHRATNEHSDIIIKNEDVKYAVTDTFWLSKKPQTPGSRAYYALFPRICTYAEMEVSGGHRMRVYNTHLDHISGIARRFGIDVIMKHMELQNKKETLPIILMGDFNAKPDSTLVKHVLGDKNIRLRSVYTGGDGTYHGIGNSRQLDYIMISDEFKIIESHVDKTVYEGKYPSDHYPLIATLEIEG